MLPCCNKIFIFHKASGTTSVLISCSGHLGSKHIKPQRYKLKEFMSKEDNNMLSSTRHFNTDSSIIKRVGVVMKQNMPALDLLVFVLEAFVPVLQTLTFGLNA